MDSLNNEDSTYILPLRFIPFDIGIKLSAEKIREISNYFDLQFKRATVSDFSQSFGSELILAYQLDEKIKVYIFSYGIGVITYPDMPFVIDDFNDNFSVYYCRRRRQAHKNILHFTTKQSAVIKRFIYEIRKIAAKNARHIRVSAKESWENNGLSYVMTVSMIQTGKTYIQWKDFNVTFKRNLLALLNPSIVNMEDSLYSDRGFHEEVDISSILITEQNEPENFSYSPNYSLFISWAAVVSIHEQINKEYIEMIEALEIDLQAMWMYIYCERSHLKMTKKEKRTELEKQLYSVQREYMRFMAIEDSSAPEYIIKIRNALIDTSGIAKMFSQFVNEIKFDIQQVDIYEKTRDRTLEYYKVGICTFLVFIEALSFCLEIFSKKK